MIRGWMVPLVAGGAYGGADIARQRGDNEVVGAVIGGISALAAGVGASKLFELLTHRGGSAAAQAADAAKLLR